MLFFLPYATDRPRRRTPVVTYGLLAANCLVFFLLELPRLAQGDSSPWDLAFVPGEPRVATFLLSMFSHAGFLHLAGNMLFLWLFGAVIEDTLGPVVFAAFYFGGAVGAMLLDTAIAQAFVPDSLSIGRMGASGAISGILGLTAVCLPTARVRVLYLVGYFVTWRGGVARIQAWVFLGAWLAYQLFAGFASTSVETMTGQASGGVAYWAHIGGFLAGMVGALVLRLPQAARKHYLITEMPHNDEEAYAAYAELQQVVRDSPDNAEAWFALARDKEVYGFTAEAGEAYARAAGLFAGRHELDRAAEAYAAALHYDPSFSLPPSAQFDLAVSLAHSGDQRKALTAFDRLLKAHPDSAEAEIAWIRAGELAEKLNDPATAATYYDAYLRRHGYGEWTDFAQQRLAALGRD